MSSFHPELEIRLLKLFNNKTDGFFVDIGAHDGISGSNTYFLENLGWSGVCVEPLKYIYDQLIVNRKCVCENCALWTKNGKVSFMSLSGYTQMLSGIVESYNPRHILRIKDELNYHGGLSEIIEVPSKTFDSVVKVKNIDFLSIDTEGSELDILQTIDFDFYDIRVICVENNYGDPKINEFLSEKNYTLIQTYNIDFIFQKKE